MPKTISIYGRPFVVGGGEADAYYCLLPDGADLTDGTGVNDAVNADRAGGVGDVTRGAGVDPTDPVLVALRSHVGPQAVCVDAGANIGLYSLAMSALAPDGRVYAFEPSPTAFGHLEENLRRNRVPNVEASPLALGDRAGTVEFHDFSYFSAGSFAAGEGSLLSSASYGSTVSQAPVTTLDQVAADVPLERVDLVKIDVEGAELSVLEGAAAVLAAHRPTVILEFNSFAFAMHQSVLPQVALARIRRTFPYVYVIGREDGTLARLESPSEEYDFLYDNGIHGPSDNFVCTFADLDVGRRYERIGGKPPEGPSEADEMRRTMSWRITRPLREAKARLQATRAATLLAPWLARRAEDAGGRRDT